MKIKLTFVVADWPVGSYRLCRAGAYRRLGAAVSADAVGEYCRAAAAGLEARAARSQPSHLPKDAPNILIILLDDVGFGLADTYGGPIHTPTLSRIANAGISYNAFHTTSICSPTRAALLTGRNHQRVGSGTIAERAVDWDGYTGVIPRTSATLPKVLGALRLQDRRVRQVAQHACDRDHRDGSVHAVADRRRHRLRLFLRLPRRRDVAVGAAPVRELQRDRAAARSEVPPERRSRRQGDHLAARAPRVRARQAVPDVLGAGCRAWPAPHLQRVGRQVQGPVRRRLGRAARAHVQAAEGTRLDSRRHAAHAARRIDGRRGTAFRNRSGRSSGG